MKTKPNDQVTPITLANEQLCEGLTKREYFAAMALQGLAANTFAWQELDPESQAELAVLYAEELVKALNASEASE